METLISSYIDPFFIPILTACLGKDPLYLQIILSTVSFECTSLIFLLYFVHNISFFKIFLDCNKWIIFSFSKSSFFIDRGSLWFSSGDSTSSSSFDEKIFLLCFLPYPLQYPFIKLKYIYFNDFLFYLFLKNI